MLVLSHLLQMRGLKLVLMAGFIQKTGKVASFTDAWIETSKYSLSFSKFAVASFTDAWIETTSIISKARCAVVASFTDAWIETSLS